MSSSSLAVFDAAVAGDVDAIAAHFSTSSSSSSIVDCRSADDDATLLHLAAEHGHYLLCQWLLEKSSSSSSPLVHAVRHGGRTALHDAAQAGHADVCRLLINAGASVTATDAAGGTPLHLSCQFRHGTIARLLVLAGADLNAENHSDISPRDIVVKQHQTQAAFSSTIEPDSFLASLVEAEYRRKRFDTIMHSSPTAASTKTHPGSTPSKSFISTSVSRSLARSLSGEFKASRIKGNAPRPPISRKSSEMNVEFHAMPATLARTDSEGVKRGSLDMANSKRALTRQASPPATAATAPIRKITINEMNFGDSLWTALTPLQHQILQRLAERRITEMMGEMRIMDLLRIPGTGSKPKFYKRDPVPPPEKDSKIRVFGIPIEFARRRTGNVYQIENGAHVVIPSIVYQCLTFLEKEGLHMDGIFRKPGNTRRMAELQVEFDTRPGRKVDFGGNSVHDIAGLLKRYIRELPEPLLTPRLQKLFFAAQEFPDVRKRLTCLQLLTLVLPDANRDLLQALLFFLNKISRFAEGVGGNRMDAGNLAVVFAPTLLVAETPQKGAAAESQPLDSVSAISQIQQAQELGKVDQSLTETMINSCEHMFLFQRLRARELPLSREQGGAHAARSSPLTVDPESDVKRDTPNSPLSAASPRSPASPRLAAENGGTGTASPTAIATPLSGDGAAAAAAAASSPKEERPQTPRRMSNRERFLRESSRTLQEILVSMDPYYSDDTYALDEPHPVSYVPSEPKRRVSRHKTTAYKAHRRSISLHEQAYIAAQLTSELSSSSISEEAEEESPESPESSEKGGIPIRTSRSAHEQLSNIDEPSSSPPNSAPNSMPLSGRSLSPAMRAMLRNLNLTRPQGQGFVFLGNRLNDEIAKRYLKDYKHHVKYLFGDIEKADAKKIVRTVKKGENEPPPVTKELEEMDLEALSHRMADPAEGVLVKDRRYRLKLVKSCFYGRDAADWICANAIPGRAITRREAMRVGREMLERGYFRFIFKGADFVDDTVLYRFSAHSIPGAAGDRNTPSPQYESPNDSSHEIEAIEEESAATTADH